MRVRNPREALARVVGRRPGTLFLKIDGVPVNLLEYRYSLLESTSQVAGLPVPIASIVDLACMKLSAIAGRGAARDFWDLHEIITVTGRSLSDLLAAFQRKFPVEDLGHAIRSLGYFADAETAPLPAGLEPSRWATIKRDFEGWIVPVITG
jgi:Nucleotidyl transferase AbiEii toxin, Type IV TA system